jgi:hypothetical protein
MHPPRPHRSNLRCSLGAVTAAIAFVVLPCAASQAKNPRLDLSARKATASGSLVTTGAGQPLLRRSPAPPSESTADFAVTPLVSTSVREFVQSDSDLKRSSLLGRIVIPLVLLLLVERELLAVGGRPQARTLLAYGLPLISWLAMLVLVRLHAYVG